MLKYLFRIEKVKKEMNNINDTINEIEIELNKIKQIINK